MSDALAMIRRDLGPDAVVLHTRSCRRGGLFGLGAREVIEVMAADGREVGRARRRQRVAAAVPTPAGSQRTDPRGLERSGPQSGAGDLIRRTYAAARADLSRQTGVGDRSPLPTPPQSSIGFPAEQITDEMRAVKRMVARLMCQQKMHLGSGTRQPEVPDKLFDQYLALLEQEVAEDLAQKIIEQVRDMTKEGVLHDEAVLRRALREAVAGLIQTDDSGGSLGPTDDGRPRTIALVGPTGVGKTTTVAKLAANFKLKQKRSVGLVTLDTYRIAAVDQLQTYADIIGLPLHVVTNPHEMVEVDRRCRGSDVVLIDTAGRSQHDDPKLKQLASFIAAARPHEVHLVLSSTCTQKVLFDTVERFSGIPTDRIIFTKLDEAVNFGVLVNVAQKVNKRLSFLTTGQEVPHQIEPSTGDRIAALILGHEAVDSRAVPIGAGAPAEDGQ